jgi:predicted RNA-binding protein YlxR (DUF448 family)
VTVKAAREPERTCVGCRERSSKRSLLRIAATPSGEILVDPSGRTPGRGAYVHRDPACVAAAFARGGALWRALRAQASTDAAARLRHEMERELQA